MPNQRFSDEQIIGCLEQVEADAAMEDLGRQHGFSNAPFHN